uniref:Uncharacterized protein n=1 Tax=Pseudo-nitzschia australis TaxID=44445 RepID=A0A6U9X0K7_9STRA|mmetsp:Transcript_26078/g.54882  ORF Transcript_26078/g.54882 Transcript_26078/m.54882 type:complete len:212 (-) Transcript_26078:4-639(-)
MNASTPCGSGRVFPSSTSSLHYAYFIFIPRHPKLVLALLQLRPSHCATLSPVCAPLSSRPDLSSGPLSRSLSCSSSGPPGPFLHNNVSLSFDLTGSDTLPIMANKAKRANRSTPAKQLRPRRQPSLPFVSPTKVLPAVPVDLSCDDEDMTQTTFASTTTPTLEVLSKNLTTPSAAAVAESAVTLAAGVVDLATASDASSSSSTSDNCPVTF